MPRPGIARRLRVLALASSSALTVTMTVCVARWAALYAEGRLGHEDLGPLVAAALCVGAAAILAVPLAILVGAGALALGDEPRRRAAVSVALVIAEAMLAFALARYGRDHAVTPAIVRTLGGVVLGAGAGWLVLRMLRRRAPPWLPGLLSLTPAAAPPIIWWLLPDHMRAHPGVGWSLVVAAVAPYAARIGPRIPARLAWGGGLVGLCCAVGLATSFDRDLGLAAALRRHHEPVALVAFVGRQLTDFDDDGASGLFGGGDCAPFDPRVGPGRTEIAGNGVDDNCVLGDLEDDAEPSLTLAPGPTPYSGFDVLVLDVDALRPDRMSIYGYGRDTTPQLVRWFADAFVFTRAYSEASATRDTIASMLSGRRRVEVLWTRRKEIILDPRNRFITHAMREQGYRPLGVLPLVALNSSGTAQFGFDALHDYDHRLRTSAPLVNRFFLDELAATEGPRPRPYFAFLHYSEPHGPYVEHRRFASVSRRAYDQEVAAVDEAIGELLGQLSRDGRLARTIVVLASDHGEAFGEHGHYFHNRGAYEEDLRVPLLIRVPGMQGRRIDTPVSTTALAATLLELLGHPLPSRRPPTVASLVPLLRGEAVEAPPVVGVNRAWKDDERFAIVSGTDKILFDRGMQFVEVYDLQADPTETVNLLEVEPDRVRRMDALARHYLEHVIGAAASRFRRDAEVELVPQELRSVAEAPSFYLGSKAALNVVPGTFHDLPPRVFVRSYFRRDAGASVLDRDGYAVHVGDQVSDEPIFDGQFTVAGYPEGAVVEDVRAFKVYPKDLDDEVWVEVEGARVGLGTARSLPVWYGE